MSTLYHTLILPNLTDIDISGIENALHALAKEHSSEYITWTEVYETDNIKDILSSTDGGSKGRKGVNTLVRGGRYYPPNRYLETD